MLEFCSEYVWFVFLGILCWLFVRCDMKVKVRTETVGYVGVVGHNTMGMVCWERVGIGFLGYSVSCLIHFGKMAKPYWEYVGAVGVVGKVIVMVFLGKCWSSVLRYSMLALGMGNAIGVGSRY